MSSNFNFLFQNCFGHSRSFAFLYFTISFFYNFFLQKSLLEFEACVYRKNWYLKILSHLTNEHVTFWHLSLFNSLSNILKLLMYRSLKIFLSSYFLILFYMVFFISTFDFSLVYGNTIDFFWSYIWQPCSNSLTSFISIFFFWDFFVLSM